MRDRVFIAQPAIGIAYLWVSEAPGDVPIGVSVERGYLSLWYELTDQWRAWFGAPVGGDWETASGSAAVSANSLLQALQRLGGEEIARTRMMTPFRPDIGAFGNVDIGFDPGVVRFGPEEMATLRERPPVSLPGRPPKLADFDLGRASNEGGTCVVSLNGATLEIPERVKRWADSTGNRDFSLSRLDDKDGPHSDINVVAGTADLRFGGALMPVAGIGGGLAVDSEWVTLAAQRFRPLPKFSESGPLNTAEVFGPDPGSWEWQENVGHLLNRLRNLFGEQSPMEELFSALDNKRLRHNAAVNPALPPDVLDHLAHCTDEGVRSNVAANSSLSPDLISFMADDPSPRVREALLRRTDLPVAVRSRLEQN